jgi:hypothetical protein
MLYANLILLAAPPNLEWFLPAIVVLLFVIQIIRAVITGVGNPNVPQRRPPGQIPRMPPPPPQGEENQALKGEIEEFLRRVSNRREGQPQRPHGAPSRPIPVARPQPSGSPPDRRRRPPPVVIATAGVPVAEVQTPGQRDDIQDLVKRHLNTRGIEQRAGKLTNIGEHERQFERQVQQTFAHEVGHLKPSSLSSPDDARSVSDTAPQVVDENRNNKSFALLTGSNLINAVIVNEIMQRPEHRW